MVRAAPSKAPRKATVSGEIHTRPLGPEDFSGDAGAAVAKNKPKVQVGASVEASAAGGGVETTRVGRWMSPDELAAMQESGVVQLNHAGVHKVATPASPSAYRAAPSGDVFVTYDVPSSSLSKGGSADWRMIHGPESRLGKLRAKQGRPVSDPPRFENLQVHETKK